MASSLPEPVVPPRAQGLRRRPEAVTNPAAVYVATLAPSGRRAMSTSLEQMARALSSGQLGAGDLDWAQLRYEHTAALRAWLVGQVAARAISPATANRHLSALRGALRAAWRMGQLSTDDFHRAIDVGRVKGTRLPAGRSVDAQERSAILGRIPASPIGDRDRAVIGLLYYAGVRRAELAAALLEDVALDVDPPTFRVLGKGQRERLVPMSPDVIRLVDPWLSWRGLGPGPLVCAVDRTGRVHVERGIGGEAIRQILVRRARAAGVATLSPHDLRRSAAGDLLDAGADLAVVARLLGHASVTTTSRYDRRGARAVEEAARRLRIEADPSGA